MKMHRTVLLLALPLAQAEWGRNDASKWKGTAPPLDTSARPPAYNPDAFDVYDTPLPSAPAYDGPEDDWGVDYKPPPPPPTRRRQREIGRSRATASSQKRSRDSYAGDAYGEEADLVDEYVRTAKGRALVSAGAAGVGAALGAGISEVKHLMYAMKYIMAAAAMSTGCRLSRTCSFLLRNATNEETASASKTQIFHAE
jgi:hypothetical protein